MRPRMFGAHFEGSEHSRVGTVIYISSRAVVDQHTRPQVHSMVSRRSSDDSTSSLIFRPINFWT